MIAIESIFCCKCAWMAVATPSAPITSAIRLTSDRNVVDCRSPCSISGCASRVIGNQPFAKHLAQIVAHTVAIGMVGGTLNRNRSAARLPGDQQAGTLQSCARNHHARTHIETAGHAIRLIRHFGADPERLSADANGVADVRVQPQQDAVGNGHRIRLQGGAEHQRRIEFHRAVERDKPPGRQPSPKSTAARRHSAAKPSSASR